MRADGRNELLRVGVNKDVVECWQICYERFKEQPRNLVEDIRYDGTVDDKCQAIFGYMCDHVQYELDKEGAQYIKSPARLIADGRGDCKSLTMFVNFDGGSQYTHVYPVAIDENGNEIIMDMCETDKGSETIGMPLYDYARPYKRKKDIIYG